MVKCNFTCSPGFWREITGVALSRNSSWCRSFDSSCGRVGGWAVSLAFCVLPILSGGSRLDARTIVIANNNNQSGCEASKTDNGCDYNKHDNPSRETRLASIWGHHLVGACEIWQCTQLVMLVFWHFAGAAKLKESSGRISSLNGTYGSI